MRKEYRKIVRRTVENYFKTRQDGFKKRQPTDAVNILPGDIVFSKETELDVVLVVDISFNPKGYDEFDITLGWSNLGDYPIFDASLGIPASPDRVEFEYPEFICGLDTIDSSLSHSFKIPKRLCSDLVHSKLSPIERLLSEAEPIPQAEAAKMAEPIVAGALNHLTESGIPYLYEYLSFQRKKSVT